ncbi:hypothetical protein QFZ26_000762 [Agromyces ramosus]|uniref:Uncharacterized protein n=1 Tax=Agromyces ramosus TaxID=33879 RepID=A0ABU0R549_9MICO|nr:hypothetical protein [Agromyces ramosus]
MRERRERGRGRDALTERRHFLLGHPSSLDAARFATTKGPGAIAPGPFVNVR